MFAHDGLARPRPRVLPDRSAAAAAAAAQGKDVLLLLLCLLLLLLLSCRPWVSMTVYSKTL